MGALTKTVELLSGKVDQAIAQRQFTAWLLIANWDSPWARRNCGVSNGLAGRLVWDPSDG